MSVALRETLSKRLRAITGWGELNFDRDGVLRVGHTSQAIGGSASARELLIEASTGQKIVVLEDASNRSDVVFARVIDARWTRDAAQKRPVQIILIDFADFSHVFGDPTALAAFDEGWAMLHELAHIVHDSVDAERDKGPGECEALINVMRRECGVPERAEYFFDYFPGQAATAFATRLVRLPFDHQSPNSKKKKRFWIMWDAALVGGLDPSTQVARN